MLFPSQKRNEKYNQHILTITVTVLGKTTACFVSLYSPLYDLFYMPVAWDCLQQR